MTVDTEVIDRIPAYGDLEALFVNNENLDRIEGYLSRFNPIRVMRMERQEIRHSAILAWLLDPAETHGLGDRFLKAFLCEALRGDGDTCPTALDISRWDMRDTQVRLEWQNIDIFLHSDRNDAAFIIENKLDSRQHGGQLARYKEKVRSTYDTDNSGLAVRGIFLTLWDEVPEDESYATVGYEAICTILPHFIAQESNVLTTEIAIFLGHYLEILKDVTGMSEDLARMQTLARQLYRTHKKVLDFVVEHGATSDFGIAVRSMVDGENDANPQNIDVTIGDADYRLNWYHAATMCFLPKEWHSALAGTGRSWPGCEGWWTVGYPVISWIEIITGEDGMKGKLVIHAEVGPLDDHEAQRNLVEGIKAVGSSIGSERIAFRSMATNRGKKFFKDNMIEVSDVQNPDEIADGIGTLLKRFRPEFEAIADILPGFENYAEVAE